MDNQVSSTTEWDIDDDVQVITEFVRDNAQFSQISLENIHISNTDIVLYENSQTQTSQPIQVPGPTRPSKNSSVPGNLPPTATECDFESLHKLRYWSNDELVTHISKLLNWLVSCIQRPDLLTITPDTSRQIYYLSCVLWLSQETSCDLSSVLTIPTFNALLDWTLQSSLKPKYTLMKHAVDRVLCSMYAMRPDLFNNLLERLGIILPVPTNATEGNATEHHQFKFLDIRQPCFEPYHITRLASGYTLNLTETLLRTLSTISLSYIPADQLINSGFLALLVDMVIGFITYDESDRVESIPATRASGARPVGSVDVVLGFLASVKPSGSASTKQNLSLCWEFVMRYRPGITNNSDYSSGTSSDTNHSAGITPGAQHNLRYPVGVPVTGSNQINPTGTPLMSGLPCLPVFMNHSGDFLHGYNHHYARGPPGLVIDSSLYARRTAGAVNPNSGSSDSSEVTDLTQTLPRLNADLEHPILDNDVISAILIFFSELSWQNCVKMWLGSEEIIIFWERLLKYLCITVPTSKNGAKYSLKNKLNAKSVSKMEDAAITFFYKCCSCCPQNQERLAQVIYNVLSQMSTTSMKSHGIMDFTRRVLLELVIGPDSVFVSVEADIDEGIFNSQSFTDSSSLSPPAFPPSKKHHLFYLSTDCTCTDIIEKATNGVADSANEGRTSSSKRTMNLEYQSTFSGSKKLRLNDDFEISREDLEAAGSSKGTTRASAQQTCPKLLLWAPTDRQFVNVSQNSTIADMLRIFVPNGDELEVPVVKFFLTRNTQAGADEMLLSNGTGIPPSLIFKKFVELRGVELVAQYIEAKSSHKVNSAPATKKKKILNWSTIPMHSLIAFGQFSRLPEYRNLSEVRRILRPVYGLREEVFFNIEKNSDCFSMDPTTLCRPFGVLPFELLSNCFRENRSRDGANLRASNIIDLLLMYLALYTHQPESVLATAIRNENTTFVTAIKQCYSPIQSTPSVSRSSPHYWPKGTGYSSRYSDYASLPGTSGSGESTSQRIEEEEELVTSLFQVLAVYINPRPKHYTKQSTNADQQLVLPTSFIELIQKSCLRQVLVNYLRNESVLDIVRHIPLYKAIMQLLRVMVFNPQTIRFLTSTDDYTSDNLESDDNKSIPIVEWIRKMNTCVDMYKQQLSRSHIEEKYCTSTSGLETDENDLISDIQLTASLIEATAMNFVSQKNSALIYSTSSEAPALTKDVLYLKIMKSLQFGTFDMITENEDGSGGVRFNVDYRYANEITSSMVTTPARMKRLAQESASLATSLPLSYESAIFVRCDTDRLDAMKVLITGPPDTPYMNGCFEFDVFFPQNYPNSPMLVNLKTTGKGRVRFNPNLYACGKVCLSLLNTWSSGAQEMWNPRTSNLIQVLVSIQALVFVSQPYFNEPGYEMSRGDSRTQKLSKEYNEKLMPHTIKWAMLDQIQNPSPCFKEVIQAHFWLKRDEIKQQITQWMNDCDPKYKEQIQVQSNKLLPALGQIPQPRLST